MSWLTSQWEKQLVVTPITPCIFVCMYAIIDNKNTQLTANHAFPIRHVVLDGMLGVSNNS